ncbi:hypothetical protein ACFY8Z_35870 [Streptomyces microflavus]|uniref:tetratricopeptide repeat protein n=1 Tax=Streptomyces microflavus TaxID=1919 RepID=UPI0036EEFFB9
MFTDRKTALRAVNTLLRGDGPGRVLLLTGLSGMGKSTVLAHVRTHPQSGWRYAVVDAEALVSGMAVRAEGAEEAALELLRQVAGHLASLGPWWRRRWLRQKAVGIGSARPWRVSVRQWAGFGGRISNSPVDVVAGARTQGERRGQWASQLLAVARGVRRRRLLLMVDTCEWLAYFDDVRAEVPRAGQPYGVGGWFSGVVDGLLDAMPGLRVVLAGTAAPAVGEALGSSGKAGGRVVRLELQPWKAGDTRTYLARRGIPATTGAATAVTDAEGGLPVSISWIADVLTGLLTDGPAGTGTADQVLADLTELSASTNLARAAWLRGHVLDRLSSGTLRLLQAAAVLETFTPAALLAVADSGAPADHDAFTRLTRTSCIDPHPGPDKLWRVHAVMRDWLLEAARDHDAQQPPSRRILPLLHQSAADYYEALAGDAGWSLRAVHHRFATGDSTHALAWTTRLSQALQATPLDTLQLQLLTDAALTAEHCEDALPAVAADAYLAAAYLAYQRAEYPTAQTHAEQALALYRTLDNRSGAVKAAARLAGQVAWMRFRYQDATTHWTTALDPAAPHGTDHLAEPGGYRLRLALTEAVLRTGDARRAHKLLQVLPNCETSGTGSTNSPGTGMEYVLPPYALGTAVPPTVLGAYLHRLRAEIAFLLNDYDQAADHARRVLDDPAADRHGTALAHRLLARIANRAWDLGQAQDHIGKGTAAARQCPDRSCLVMCLLTRAEIAERQAQWAQPTDAASPTPPPSLSLTRRAESARQRELAATQRDAAKELATDLQNAHLQAQTKAKSDPAIALTLYRTIGDRRGEADVLNILADIAHQRNDLDSAQKHTTNGLALTRTIGDRHGEARALEMLADIAGRRDDLDGAQKYAEQALTLYRTISERRGEANALRILANVAGRHDDIDGAQKRTEQALTLYRTIGDCRGEADVLNILADIAHRRNDLDSAQKHTTNGLALTRTIGDRHGEAGALEMLADIAGRRDDLDGAQKYAERALTLYRTISDRRCEARALRMLAGIAVRRDDLDGAQKYAERALTLYRTISERRGEASALYVLAEAAARGRHLEEANKHATQALALYRATRERLGEANTLGILMVIAGQYNDLDGAKRYATQALTLARTLDNRITEANVLLRLAEAVGQSGDIETGRRYMEQAVSLYQEIGDTRLVAWCRSRLQKW